MKRRVVITGLGAITPIGNTVEEFWNGIKNGTVGIGPITKFDTTEYKSGNPCRTDTAFRTTCKHYVRISVLNGTVCVTDAVGSGCTGRYHVGAFASGTCCNGYISRCHVADHLWNKKWINLRGSPFSQP